MTPADPGARFDAKFAHDPDPWGTRERWYEIRKRTLMMAALPHARYACAYEPGCANGETTALIAPRCDRLVASDASEKALAIARARLANQANVTLECRVTPDDWPSGRFDLIVLSEFGYFMPDDALARLARRCPDALTESGVVVACHWRHAADDFFRSGDAVHAELQRHFPWQRAAHHVEADFVLDVWCADGRSVAQREGLA